MGCGCCEEEGKEKGEKCLGSCGSHFFFSSGACRGNLGGRRKGVVGR